MKAYERDCGCVYCHSWRMYSHAATASFERYAVTKRPVNDGTRKPWRNRCISPVSLAGRPNRFCPVPLRIAFAHWNSCPYVSALRSAPLGMYFITSLLATITYVACECGT